MSNELYHYGVPGMRWGRRRGGQKISITNLKNKTKNKSEKNNTKPKPKMSKGKKIAIGSAVTAVALAGVGKLLTSRVVQDKYMLLKAGRALVENL